jgi:hypothetical protein
MKGVKRRKFEIVEGAILLKRPLPESGEGAQAYVSRLAQVNQYSLESLEQSFGVRIDLMYTRGYRRDFARNLAAALKDDPAKFESLMSFPGQSTLTKSGIHDIAQEVYELERGVIAFGRPRYCPCCLKEGSVWKKEWEFTAATSCQQHGIVLLDDCWHCKKPLEWNEVANNRHSLCGQSLTSAPGVSVGNSVDLTSRLLNHFYNPTPRQRRSKNRSAIGDIDFETLSLLFVGLGLQFTNQFCLPFRRRKPSLIKNNVLHEIGVIIEGFLRDWPIGAKPFLQKLCAFTCPDIPGSGHQVALQIFQDGLAGYAIGGGIRSELLQVAAAILSHRQNAAVLLFDATHSRLLFPKHLRGSYDSNEAFKLLSISEGQLSTYLKKGRTGGNNRGANAQYSGATLRDALLLRLSEVSADTAALSLGVSRHNLTVLVKSGLLKEWRGPRKDGTRDRLYLVKDLQDFYQGVAKSASAPLVLRSANLVDLEEALCGHVTTAGLNLGHLISGVISGRLQCAGIDDGASGLKRFLFQHTSFNGLMSSNANINGYWDVAQASLFLGCYRDFVRTLSKAGRLGTTIRLHQGNGIAVEIAAVKAFDKVFISIARLASIYGMSSQQLRNRLHYLGIEPSGGPNIDGTVITYYKRKSIAGLTTEKLKGATSGAIEPLTGRRGERNAKENSASSSEMSVQDACSFLGLSQTDISKLARRGYLTLYRKAGKKYVVASDLLRYKSKFLQSDKFVDIDKAVKLLKARNKRELTMRWVRSGKLQLIDNGFTKLVLLDEIQSCECIQQQTYSSMEAQECLGISRTDISNLVRLGKLKPVSGPAIDGAGILCFDRNEIDKIARRFGKAV